jgi:hypothetical protein
MSFVVLLDSHSFHIYAVALAFLFLLFCRLLASWALGLREHNSSNEREDRVFYWKDDFNYLFDMTSNFDGDTHTHTHTQSCILLQTVHSDRYTSQVNQVNRVNFFFPIPLKKLIVSLSGDNTFTGMVMFARQNLVPRYLLCTLLLGALLAPVKYDIIIHQ